MSQPEPDPAESERADRGLRWWELVAAVAVGLGVGVGAWAVLTSDDDEEPLTVLPTAPTAPATTEQATTTTESATSETTATETTQPPTSATSSTPSETITSTEAAPLLDAYRRSLDATFALDGEVIRTRGGQTTVTATRRAHRDPRRLDELGAVSVVIDGDTLRQCDRSSGTVLCTDPEPAASDEQRVAQFESLVGGTASLYDVFTPDLATLGDLALPPPGSTSVSCWTIVARVAGEGQRFGDEASLCFDDASGALVSRHVRTGDTEERFRTLRLRSEVADEDLDPSRS